jgi:hypothetical protein
MSRPESEVDIPSKVASLHVNLGICGEGTSRGEADCTLFCCSPAFFPSAQVGDLPTNSKDPAWPTWIIIEMGEAPNF